MIASSALANLFRMVLAKSLEKLLSFVMEPASLSWFNLTSVLKGRRSSAGAGGDAFSLMVVISAPMVAKVPQTVGQARSELFIKLGRPTRPSTPLAIRNPMSAVASASRIVADESENIFSTPLERDANDRSMSQTDAAMLADVAVLLKTERSSVFSNAEEYPSNGAGSSITTHFFLAGVRKASKPLEACASCLMSF